jgi:hypothetical protein
MTTMPMKGLPPELWGLGGANALPPELFGGAAARPQRNWADVVMMIGAGLKDASSGGSENLMGVMKTQADRATKVQQAELIGRLAPYIRGEEGGGVNAIPEQLLVQMAMGGVKGLDSLIALRGQNMPNVQVDNGSGTPYNSKDPATLEKRFRRPETVNDVIVDMSDPDNIERHVPQLGAGMTYAVDASGRKTSVAPVAGYTDSLAATAGAQARAEAGGRADFQPVQATDPYGRTVATTAGNLARSGPIVGQTPGQAAFDAERGKQQAAELTGLTERVKSGDRQIGLLMEAQAMLPDVITGAGAEARLAGSRLLAGIGDEKAKRQVAATETFKNVMGRQVLDIVKQLGSGSGITDADRQFAQQIAGGDIELNAETIARVIDINRRQIEADRQRLQSYQGPAAPAPSRAPAAGPSMQGRGYKIISVE